MLTDLLLADLKMHLFFKTILLLSVSHLPESLLSKTSLSGWTTSSSPTSFGPSYNSAEFYSAGSLYDHMIAHLHFIILRIKIIYFADISEI